MADFLADQNVSRAVVDLLRNAGYRVTRALESNLQRAPDWEVFLFAVRSGRTIISHDPDYELLHGAWHFWTAHAWGGRASHPGVLRLPSARLAETTFQRLEEILSVRTSFLDELWVYDPDPVLGWHQPA